MANADDLRIDIRRSFLGRARGLGSSKSGFHHWWMTRLTSIALVPLTIWFVFALVSHAGAPYDEVRAWAGRPVNATLLLAVIVTTFHHMHMGVQTVAEDYIHTEAIRMPLVLVVKAAAFLLGLACIISVLKLAFSG